MSEITQADTPFGDEPENTEIIDYFKKLGEEIALEKQDKIIQDTVDPLQGARYFDGLLIRKAGRDYIIEIPQKAGKVLVTFTEILRSRQSFEAVVKLEVFHHTEGRLSEFGGMRLDINSQSAIGNLVTSLNSAFGNAKASGFNWALILNQAGMAMKKNILEERDSVNVSHLGYSEDEFLFFPFLQKNASNMVFGDGEAGKTYFSLALVAHSLVGRDFFGYSGAPMKTLLVDYETSEQSFASRLHRLANGMGVPVKILLDNIEYYKPESSMRDEAEIVARIVEKKQFALVIIDAGADASGSPNDEDKVLMMFNSLNNIPCTKLIIHHEPKETMGKEADKAYYGTTYWRNRVRQSFRLTVEQKENPLKTIVKATNTKSNDSAREVPFIYAVEFSPKLAILPTVMFTRVDEFKPTDEQRIVTYLIEVGKATTNEIADATGISRVTLQRRLQELLEKDVIERERDESHVRRIYWKVTKR